MVTPFEGGEQKCSPYQWLILFKLVQVPHLQSAARVLTLDYGGQNRDFQIIDKNNTRLPML